MVHFTVLGMGVVVFLNVSGRFQLELQRSPLRASEGQEEMTGWGQVNGVMGDKGWGQGGQGVGTRWKGVEERVMWGWKNGVQRKGRRTHATKQTNKKQITLEKAQVAEHQN